MRDFRSVKVWQKAHKMVLAIYKATVSFPREEVYLDIKAYDTL